MRNRTHGAGASRDRAGSGNALADGAAFALFAVVTGVLAIPARSLDARSNIIAGGAASALGIGRKLGSDTPCALLWGRPLGSQRLAKLRSPQERFENL